MTAKCSLFVDAGYLLASAASLLTGTSLRSGIHVKFGALVRGLIREAEEITGLPVLRVHWYDSAKDGVPDRAQERIGELPKVKLRLGRFGYDGQQKGVDLRLGLDMVTHARHQAAEVFLLVSGDDDLTEAVDEAQVHGVSVVVLAVPNVDGHPHAVSRHLVRAADEVITLSPAIIEDAVIPIETPEPIAIEPPPPHVGLFPAALLAHQTQAAPTAEPAPALPPRSPNEDFVLELPNGTTAVIPTHAVALEPSAPLGTSTPETADIGTTMADTTMAGSTGTGSAATGSTTTSPTPPIVAPANETLEIPVVPSLESIVPPPVGPPSPGELPGTGEQSTSGDADIAVPAAPVEVAPSVGAEPSPEPVVNGQTMTGENITEAPVEPVANSVVEETLVKLLPPTPRDLSGKIGRPVARTLRPTYTPEPETPREGTWAHHWSETLDSVVGRVLASLIRTSTPEAWRAIGLGRPSVPQEIDKALLLDATEAMGVYTLTDGERHEVRAAFWREYDRIMR